MESQTELSGLSAENWLSYKLQNAKLLGMTKPVSNYLYNPVFERKGSFKVFHPHVACISFNKYRLITHRSNNLPAVSKFKLYFGVVILHLLANHYYMTI